MKRAPAAKPGATPRAANRPAPGIDVEATTKVVLTSLEDDKAEDILAIDIRGKSSFADMLVVASGRSSGHVGALADHVMRNLNDVKANLATLRGEQIKVVIDDFGTGASTVERFIEVDADALKLDRSLIADIETAPERAEIISAVASAARLAGLEVVAEGIERTSQLEVLLAAGCTYGQGYLFSRPVPASSVPSILDR